MIITSICDWLLFNVLFEHWLSKFSYAKLVKFQIQFKNVYIIQIFVSIYITFIHYITMLSLPFSLEPAWWKTVEC